MLARARTIAIALLVAIAAGPGAQAQTTAEVARKWGLIGTWRLDCTRPRSGDNPDLAYVVRDGKLFHDRHFGNNGDSNAVITAVVKANKAIEVVVKFDSLNQTRQFALMKGPDGRIRAISNRNVDTNEYSIRDGKFTANGATPPWQTRCR
jgi:hypothetical protein